MLNSYDHFLIDDVPHCRSLKKDLKISTVEGVSYFKDPIKAMNAQYHACSNKHEVILGTLDAQIIKIPCLKYTEPSKNYYEIDANKLLALLNNE